MISLRFAEIFRHRVGVVLILLASISLMFFCSDKVPLSEVHWDVPIYLYRAKLLVETPLLHSYSINSYEIADQVKNQRWPEDEGFPEAYWHFSRLGNTLLLGLVAYVVNDGLQSIMVANWVYSALLAISLLLSVLLIQSVVSLLHRSQAGRTLNIAAITSVFLYVGSDIYDYLSGNLVSEVPALLLLIAGVLSFVKANEKASPMWAITSGVFAFLLYVVRMESLWAYGAGVCLLAIFLRWQNPRTGSYSILILSLVALCVPCGLYTWIFYPLSDPRLFLLFGKLQQNFHGGVSPLKLMIASGGVLWLGVVLSVAYAKRSPVIQFAFAWLALQFVPFAIGAIAGMPSQTRMYSLAMPTLMLLSTQGITCLIERPARPLFKAVIGFAIAAILIVSNPLLQSALRLMPGIWRLDPARSYFTLPKYEKVTYPVGGLAQISRFIYGISQPIVFLRDESIPQEYANLLRFFGPRHAAKNDVALLGDPTNGGDCTKKVSKAPDEPVVFCTKLTDNDIGRFSGKRLFLMTRQPIQSQVPMQKTILLEVKGLLISELKVP